MRALTKTKRTVKRERERLAKKREAFRIAKAETERRRSLFQRRKKASFAVQCGA